MKKSGFLLCATFALAMLHPCPGIDSAPDFHVDVSWLAGRGIAHAADAGQQLDAREAAARQEAAEREAAAREAAARDQDSKSVFVNPVAAFFNDIAAVILGILLFTGLLPLAFNRKIDTIYGQKTVPDEEARKRFWEKLLKSKLVWLSAGVMILCFIIASVIESIASLFR